VFQSFVGKTPPQSSDIKAAVSSLYLIIVMLVVFLWSRKPPSTVQFVFDDYWRLTFTTSMGVASRNSVSNNLKLRFEGLIAPLRANWFPFASPEKPLQSDKLRIIASCVSRENSNRFRYSTDVNAGRPVASTNSLWIARSPKCAHTKDVLINIRRGERLLE
jgi:hypothetical protein